MSELQINQESHKRCELITVSGRIDSSSAPDFDQALKDTMNAGNHNIALELNGVSYMSSAGLRGLVSAMRECKKNRGKVVLANPSDRVNEVLELAGLATLFEIYEDATAAVGSF